MKDRFWICLGMLAAVVCAAACDDDDNDDSGDASDATTFDGGKSDSGTGGAGGSDSAVGSDGTVDGGAGDGGTVDGGNSGKSCQDHTDCGDLRQNGCYAGTCKPHPCDANSNTRYFEFDPGERYGFEDGIYVVGDFSRPGAESWPNCDAVTDADRMHQKKTSDGKTVYYALRQLPAGEYSYKYLLCYPGFNIDAPMGENGIDWCLPQDADSNVDDGYGNMKGVITITGCSL